MPFPLQKYAIATGWNVALGSLTNWENLSASGVYFKPVRGWGNYQDGIDRVRGDGLTGSDGDPSTAWDWVCYHAQYVYVRTTILNGSRSGKVTIYTVTDTPNTFVRMNAILILPQLTAIDWVGRKTRTIRLPFTRLEASS